MFLHELPAESKLTITASSGEKKIELASEVLSLSEADQQFVTSLLVKSPFSSGVAVMLFTNDNQTINFASDTVQCDCIGIYEDLPHLWEHVTIKKFELPDAGKQHVIFSSHDARSFNRRKDFRQWLGADCTLTYGSPTQTLGGTIKDISVTGMGLLVSSKVEISRGTRIKVQFSETRPGHDGETVSVTYTVITQSVRSAPVNERTQLIGCRIIEAGRDYVNYLYKKQRESMQREKGTDL